LFLNTLWGRFMLKSAMLVAAVATFSVLSTGLSEALDRRVRVVNDSSRTMTKFQASNKASKSWEEDILGNDVLKPGQSVVVNINDGTGYCVFDLRATFQGGATVVRRNINICKISSWTIND
jgi:hypothetical protein